MEKMKNRKKGRARREKNLQERETGLEELSTLICGLYLQWNLCMDKSLQNWTMKQIYFFKTALELHRSSRARKKMRNRKNSESHTERKKLWKISAPDLADRILNRVHAACVGSNYAMKLGCQDCTWTSLIQLLSPVRKKLRAREREWERLADLNY